MDCRFKRGYGIFFIQAADGLPERLYATGLPARGHRKLRYFPMKMHAGCDPFGRSRGHLQVEFEGIACPHVRGAKEGYARDRAASPRGCGS
jgi:hypothetical protein